MNAEFQQTGCSVGQQSLRQWLRQAQQKFVAIVFGVVLAHCGFPLPVLALPLLTYPTADDLAAPFFVGDFIGFFIPDSDGLTTPLFVDLPDGVFRDNRVTIVMGNFQAFDPNGSPTPFQITGVEVTDGGATFTPAFGEFDFAGRSSMTFSDFFNPFSEVTFFAGDFTLGISFISDPALDFELRLKTNLPAGYFGTGQDAKTNTTPEAPTLLLVGAGLAALLSRLRRERRNAQIASVSGDARGSAGMRMVLMLLLLLASPLLFAVAPTLTAISPPLGQPGYVLTITGTGFATDPSKNDVRFGPNRAPVVSAASDKLVVRIPNGQPLGPTNVTVTVVSASGVAESSNALREQVVNFSQIPVTTNRSSSCCYDCAPPESQRDCTCDVDPGIYPELGESYQCVTDLMIPGRDGSDPAVNYAFRRHYRNQADSNGPLGPNWDHNYFERLDVQIDGSVIYRNGMGRNDRYLKNNNGEFVAPPQFFTTLVKKSDGSFELRSRGGTLKKYDTLGRLLEIRDRNRNFMTLRYDPSVPLRLIAVVDDLGRAIVYRYVSSGVNAGRLQEIEDFIGRRVTFSHDGNGDLVEVTSPAVTGTPNGNDFPSGKTTRYSYSSGYSDARLNHNLLRVIRPNEVAVGGPEALRYEYGTTAGSFSFDKVIAQTRGGSNASGVPAGGTSIYTYTLLNAGVVSDDPNLPASRLRKTDRNGNVKEYEFNRLGFPIVWREFTRGLRLVEPSVFETRMAYNADGQLIEKLLPEGNRSTYSYDEGNADRFQQGNLLREVRLPDAARGGDQTSLAIERTYEPVYQQIASITEPRGLDVAFTPPIADTSGRTKRERYTTRFFFDYQEAAPASILPLLAAELGTTQAEVQARLVANGVALGPKDLNADGDLAPRIAGRVVRRVQPPAVLLAGSNQAAIEGDRLQDIVTLFRHNAFAQTTSMVDPEGNVHTFAYFPETDPDGDGTNSPPPLDGRSLSALTGGYLREEIKDTVSAPERNNRTNPAPVNIKTAFTYDVVGNRISQTNGRGIRTEFRVNQLNQVVQIIRAAAVPAVGTGDPPEPITLTAFAYRENVFYDFNDNVVRRESEDRGNTSNSGGFVDVTSKFDILDAVVEMTREVDVTKSLVTRYRYDRNQNRVMVINPAGNAESVLHDERDLPFQRTRGANTRPAQGLYAPSDPTSFNRPGGAGTVPSTVTQNYDKNRNLIEVVDAQKHGGMTSAIAGIGDVTKSAFDGFDRRERATDPLGNTTDYFYDPASNVVRVLREGDPIDDVAGSAENKTLAVSETIHDELSRVVVTHRVLFQTPDAIPTRVPILTDTPAMDALAAYLADAPSDTAPVPAALGISVIGRVSTLTEYDRLSRRTFAVQDDLDVYRSDYDGAGRIVSTRDSALSNGFSAGAFNPAAISGNRVETAYDDNGNPIEGKETDVSTLAGVAPEEFRTTSLYDALDRLQTVVDNIGQTVDYRYDSRNNRVAKADAVGPITSRTISRRGLGSTASITINDFGNVTRTFYDGISRLLRTETLLTASSQGNGSYVGATLEGVKVAPPAGYLDPSQSEDGIIKVHHALDDNGQLLALRDDDGSTTGYIYDNQDRTLKERKGMNAGFQGTAFTITGGDSGVFDEPRTPPVPADPPVETEAGSIDNGTSSDYTYDQDSNVTTMVNEGDVNAVRSTIINSYDALNRLKQTLINNPAGSQFIGTTLQSFQYDGLSRVTSTFDNNGPAATSDDALVTYFYDSLSRRVEETQKIGALQAKAISSSFDIAQGGAVGMASSLTYPDARRIDSTYDRLDRLVTRKDNGAATDIGRYEYIGTSRVATLTYQNGTRLTHLGGAVGTTDQGFDALRRIVNHRWESFAAGTKPGMGALIVGFGHQETSGVPAYNPANDKRIEEKLHDSGNSEAYRYDSVYRAATFDRGTLDAAKKAIGTPTTDPGALQAQTWQLDGLGNWTANTQTTGGVAVTENRTHSDFNEVFDRNRMGQSAGMNERSHDKNGNTLDTGLRTAAGKDFPGGGLRLEYDALNRLRKVYKNNDTPGNTLDDLPIAEYTYDAYNRRLRKFVSNGGVPNDSRLNGTTDFYYHGWRVVEERDSSDAIVQQYTYGNYLDEVWTLDKRSGAISVADLNNGTGSDRLFYHRNGLYHVYALTDETGIIKEAIKGYDAYGKVVKFLIGAGTDTTWFTGDDTIAPMTAVGNPYAYTGQRLDPETGLAYYKNRFFDINLGRFLSRDPKKYVYGPNLYQYVGSNAVNHYDPDGLGDEAPKYGRKCRETDKCGPDITDALKRLKTELQSDYEQLNFLEKWQICNVLAGAVIWDIRDLHDGPYPSVDGCPTPPCYGTVEMFGRCVEVGEANYYMWGVINKICNEDKVKMLFQLLVWKAHYGHHPSDATWWAATYGYQDNPGDLSPPNNQCPLCGKKWNKVLKWRWGVYHDVSNPQAIWEGLSEGAAAAWDGVSGYFK